MKWAEPPATTADGREVQPVFDGVDPYPFDDRDKTDTKGQLPQRSRDAIHLARSIPGRWVLIGDGAGGIRRKPRWDLDDIVSAERVIDGVLHCYLACKVDGMPTVDEAIAVTPKRRAFYPADLPRIDMSDNGFAWTRDELDDAVNTAFDWLDAA